MTSLDKQDQEVEECRRKFDNVRAYVEIYCIRLQFLKGYFTDLDLFYSKSITHIPNVSYDDFVKSLQISSKPGKEVAPGFTPDCLQQIYKFLSFESAYRVEIQEDRSFLTKTIIPGLDKIAAKYESELKDCQKIVHAARKNRDSFAEKLRGDIKAHEKLLTDIQAMQDKVDQAKAQGASTNEVNKKIDKIKSLLESYRSSASNINTLVQKLNHAHLKFIRATSQTISRLSDGINQIPVDCANLFSSFVTLFEKISQIYQNAAKESQSINMSFVQLFTSYITNHHIVRATLPSVWFATPDISKDNPDLPPMPPPPQWQQLDYPTGLAIISTPDHRDFVSQQNFELPALDGEYVYTFESYQLPWIYVEAVQDRTRRGYLPTKVLQPEDHELVMTIDAWLATENEELSVDFGWILIVENRDKEGYVFVHAVEDPNKRGYVASSVVRSLNRSQI